METQWAHLVAGLPVGVLSLSPFAQTMRQRHATNPENVCWLGTCTKPNALTGAEREQALSGLAQSGWCEQDSRDAIEKTYEFDTFVEAFGWMTKVALVFSLPSTSVRCCSDDMGGC